VSLGLITATAFRLYIRSDTREYGATTLSYKLIEYWYLLEEVEIFWPPFAPSYIHVGPTKCEALCHCPCGPVKMIVSECHKSLRSRTAGTYNLERLLPWTRYKIILWVNQAFRQAVISYTKNLSRKIAKIKQPDYISFHIETIWLETRFKRWHVWAVVVAVTDWFQT